MMKPEERLKELLHIITNINIKTDIRRFKRNFKETLNNTELQLDLLEVLKGLYNEKDNNEYKYNVHCDNNYNKDLTSSSIITKNIDYKKEIPIRIQSKKNKNYIEDQSYIGNDQLTESEICFPNTNKEEEGRVKKLKKKMTLRKHNTYQMGFKTYKESIHKDINKTIEIAKSCSFSLSPSSNRHNNPIEYDYSLNSHNKSSQIIYEEIVNGIKSMSSTSNSLSYNKHSVPYYQFAKPTEVIVDSSMSHLIKRTMFDHESIPLNYHQLNQVRKASSNRNATQDIRAIDINAYFNNDNFNPITNRKKIYFWLIEINMFSSEQVNISDIPVICINGIFLCDLINKCEGRFEVIQGICRHIKTVSQVKVNLKKALEHLRKKPNFPCRHLWALDEIREKNEDVIWELLEDIWKVYTNKLIRAYSSNNINTSTTNNYCTTPIVNQNQKAIYYSNGIKLNKDKQIRKRNGSNTKANMKMNNDQHKNLFNQQNNLHFYNTLIKETCEGSKTRKMNYTPSIKVYNNFSISGQGYSSLIEDLNNNNNKKDRTTVSLNKKPEKYFVL